MPRLVVDAPPLSKNQAIAARQREGLQRAVRAWEELLKLLDPDEVAAAATAAVAAAASDAEDEGRRAAFARRFGLPSYTPAERATLESESRARYFAARRALLADTLTAPEVGRRLGLSRQTPHDRAKAGMYLAIQERGAWRFPAWQFDPSAPDGVVPRLPEVLRALHRVSDFAKAAWFVQPNPYLEGRRPIDALRMDPERVLDAARGVAA